MYIKIQQTALCEALDIVIKATTARSTLPILGYVLIRAEHGELSFSATNLDLGIVAHPQAEVIEPGALALPARLLHDYIHLLAPGEIEMRSLSEKNAVVSVLFTQGTRSSTTMKGLPATDFPAIPTPDDFCPVVSTEASLLKDAIGQVAFCAASDDNRQVLTGIFCCVQEKITLAAADAFRLGVSTIDLPDSERATCEVLIPVKAMVELARILEKEDAVEMAVLASRAQVCFRTSKFDLFSKLIEGTFPAFEQMIPASIPTQVRVSANELLDMCKSTLIFDTPVLRMKLGALDPESGTNLLTVEVSNEGTGNSTGSMQVNVEGKGDLALSFNGKYLQQALTGIGRAETILGLMGATKPCILRPIGAETKQIYVIMPLSVSSEK